MFAVYGLGMAAFGAGCVLLGARLGRLVRDELRADRDRCRRELARARRELAEAREPAPVPAAEEAREPEAAGRPPLPDADRAPADPVMPQDPAERELAERARQERDRERQALGDLRTWQARVSAGKRECGGRLADGLRAGLPDLADADLARVLVRLSWYAAEVETEQNGDPYDAWVVLADSLAVAAADLAAMELELTERHGR